MSDDADSPGFDFEMGLSKLCTLYEDAREEGYVRKRGRMQRIFCSGGRGRVDVGNALRRCRTKKPPGSPKLTPASFVQVFKHLSPSGPFVSTSRLKRVLSLVWYSSYRLLWLNVVYNTVNFEEYQSTVRYNQRDQRSCAGTMAYTCEVGRGKHVVVFLAGVWNATRSIFWSWLYVVPQPGEPG